MSDRIVPGAGEDVDWHVVEAEAGKDCAARRAGGALDADFNGSARARQAAQVSVVETPSDEVFGVDFEALFGEQVVNPLRAASLGTGVVGLEPAAGRQPDWELGRKGLGRVAVADDLEKASAVSEGPLVQNRRPRMAFLGHGPVVLALVDPLPIEASVDGREPAQFVEHILGRGVVEAAKSQPLGELTYDPPVGFGLAGRGHGLAQALDSALGVGAAPVGLGKGTGGEDHVGQRGGLGEEDVDDYEVI